VWAGVFLPAHLSQLILELAYPLAEKANLLFHFFFVFSLALLDSLPDRLVLQKLVEIGWFKRSFGRVHSLDGDSVNCVDWHCFVGLLLAIAVCLPHWSVVPALLRVVPLLAAHEETIILSAIDTIISDRQ
jgi:hypothetical protein